MDNLPQILKGVEERLLKEAIDLHASIGKNCKEHHEGAYGCETCWIRSQMNLKVGEIIRQIKELYTTLQKERLI